MSNNDASKFYNALKIASNIKSDLNDVSSSMKVDISGRNKSQPLSEMRVQNAHLSDLLSKLKHADENDYIREAINCAESGFHRAAIVMGWCAVIDRLQRKVVNIGYDKFNEASTKLKQSSGKFKWWTKGPTANTLTDLQRIFDNDLIIIFEGGLDIFDGNQGDRLKSHFDYRNQSAHPGAAPIGEPHLIAFFHDIVHIVFTNPKLEINENHNP